MNKEEILKKAIEKVVKKGYRPEKVLSWVPIEKLKFEILPNRIHWMLEINLENIHTMPLISASWYGLIFSHDFLKAFFENGQVCPVCGTSELSNEIENCKDAHKAECVTPFEWDIAWQFHAKRMVINPDPILYLEKFI